MEPTAELTDAPHRPLVLIVEDHADLRLLYVEHLQSSGFDVIEATDGAEAIAQTSSLQPDVVPMDLGLPLVEATRQLKADERTSHIPVVALTAYDGSGEMKRAAIAGCDWFVPKPCSPNALAAEVWRIVETHGSRVKSQG
jgi:two-component system cell cycle response regulator DivK